MNESVGHDTGRCSTGRRQHKSSSSVCIKSRSSICIQACCTACCCSTVCGRSMHRSCSGHLLKMWACAACVLHDDSVHHYHDKGSATCGMYQWVKMKHLGCRIIRLPQLNDDRLMLPGGCSIRILPKTVLIHWYTPTPGGCPLVPILGWMPHPASHHPDPS